MALESLTCRRLVLPENGNGRCDDDDDASRNKGLRSRRLQTHRPRQTRTKGAKHLCEYLSDICRRRLQEGVCRRRLRTVGVYTKESAEGVHRKASAEGVSELWASIGRNLQMASVGRRRQESELCEINASELMPQVHKN